MQELTMRDAQRALVAIIKHNDAKAKAKADPHEYMVPFFVAQPGTGKSSLVHGAAYETGRKARTLILAQYDPADVGGLIYRETLKTGETVMRKSRPAYLPQEGQPGQNDLLFLDEFSQSGQAVQNVAAQLAYDRHIGDHQLSPFSTVVLAGNSQSDRAGTAPLVRHLTNRVTMMGVKIHPDHWIEWAAQNGVHPTVVGYIAWRKTEALHKFNPQAEQNPTARSWYNVSNVMHLGLLGASDRHLTRAMISGYVGEAEGGTFMAFQKIIDDLPDPKDIIKDPMRAPVPTDPQIIYATVTALCGHADDRTVEPIIKYLDRLERKEFCVFAIRYLHNKDKKLVDHKAITGWMARNAKLFV